MGLASYANSFAGVFVLDDVSILRTEELHSLWPPWASMFCPKMVTRPLVGLSLAVNHALSGTERTGSYHAFNLLIHLLAALTLFGLVRRTLDAPPLMARFARHAAPLALGVALLWTAHPLQTESVTYVIQRAEALMGLFFLLTLYCAARSFTAPKPTAWRIAAIAAATLGMGCKQVMAMAPLLVLLHDRYFFAGSFRATLRRWPLYLGLALAWIPLALLSLSVEQFDGAGFGLGIAPQHYLLTQAGVMLRYLRLAFWPDDLSLHYDWPVARSAADVAAELWLLIPLLLAIGVGFLRRAPVSYLGLWFFLILAPTSSLIPIQDAAAEHRLYLSLAAPCALVVLVSYRGLARLWPGSRDGESAVPSAWACRVSGVLVVGLAIACALRTRARNEDYHDEARIWEGAIRVGDELRMPDALACYNLGVVLAEQGRREDAIAAYRRAIAIRPSHVKSYGNLGSELYLLGRYAEAVPYYLTAALLRPTDDERENLALLFAKLDKTPEDAERYFTAVRSPGITVGLEPQWMADVHAHLGLSLLWHAESGAALDRPERLRAANAQFRKALKYRPDHAAALAGAERARGLAIGNEES
jgi:tetratricopeptide (TPR) repeat protein